jgi:hypothetical protein
MKYTQEQRFKVIRQKKDLHFSDVLKEIKLKKNFPIKVDIEGCFYVIESKLNYDALL